ncbi:holo-ACP synthase [Chroococcidiopsis sp.]|uniref:holo-ACP synthase n=1 Tax=Chroococcidiopsis sp. TaxID=3088168 RepID=UPI003F3F8C06
MPPFLRGVGGIESYPNCIGLEAKESQDFKPLNHSLQVLEIQPFKNLLKREGEHFIKQHYTSIECNIPETGERQIQYLAGRLAAKKAIATVVNKNNNRVDFWLDIEIPRLPTGQPSVILLGRCQEIATKLGIEQWLLSISHTATYAVASAIAVI